MTRNQRLFYIISFLRTLVFTVSTRTFFLLSIRNFSFGQSLFLMICTGISSLIFEIPSGVWSDRFGRKKLFILGVFFNIIDLLIWIFTGNFILYVISGFINGLGNAIISGNLEALIHDELEETKSEGSFNDLVSNSYFILFMGRVLATLISGFLYVLNPFFPLYFTIIPLIIIFILSFFLKEPKQILSNHKNNILHLKETWNHLLNNKTIIYFIFILSFISGIGNIYFFTEQLYLKQIGFKIENIGIIFAFGAFLSALGAYSYKKILSKYNDKFIVNFLFFLLLTSSILFIFFNKIFAITGLIFLSFMFGMIMSFGKNYLILKVPKYQKSTILSIFSFGITFGYTFLNLVISIFIDKVGLGKIYFLSIILVIILIIFNFFTFNRKGNL